MGRARWRGAASVTKCGWREETGMFAHCSTKWAVFLLSLKDLLETGKGRPAPDDVPIHHD